MTGRLSEKLIPKLLARFPDRGLRVHEGRQPAASFPAAHPEVGDLLIDDDGGELTITVGELTHGHFTPKDYQLPSQEKEEDLIDHCARAPACDAPALELVHSRSQHVCEPTAVASRQFHCRNELQRLYRWLVEQRG